MKKTVVVLAFFVAALLAGLFLRSTLRPVAAKPVTEEGGVKEDFFNKEVGSPLDMQPVSSPTGYEAASPLLGSEPKPTPLQPYAMANDQELFQFENNRVSADCCPSPFTTDRGCVCLTEKDKKDFATRGGNRFTG